MNKKNLGYRLGKLYQKFRQWQHPSILKWLYVLVPIAVVFIFSNFFVWVFIIAFGIMVATRQGDNSEQTEINNNYSTIYEDPELDCEWGVGHSGYGYYMGGVKVEDDE
jgi:hypothetical protein